MGDSGDTDQTRMCSINTRHLSTITNILEFLEDITSCVDSGNPVDVVFLDFQKAFDKIPHKRLLCKLEGLGIRDCLLNWIGDWLDDRKQRVVVGGSVSSWKGVTMFLKVLF